MKIRTRKNSVLGHFSRNVSHHHQQNMGIRIFFISSAKLKLAKNLAKTKQHSEIELLLFGNYSLSSSTLSFKSNRSYFKNRTEAKCICFNEVIQLMTMKIKLKMKKNRSQRYQINRLRRRLGNKYMKCNVCLSIMMVICNI